MAAVAVRTEYKSATTLASVEAITSLLSQPRQTIVWVNSSAPSSLTTPTSTTSVRCNNRRTGICKLHATSAAVTFAFVGVFTCVVISEHARKCATTRHAPTVPTQWSVPATHHGTPSTVQHTTLEPRLTMWTFHFNFVTILLTTRTAWVFFAKHNRLCSVSPSTA